jgi:cytoskeletal protein RodZ
MTMVKRAARRQRQGGRFSQHLSFYGRFQELSIPWFAKRLTFGRWSYIFSFALLRDGYSGLEKRMGELGDLLRKTREEKGLSLEQVEEAIKIRHAYLQALEEEAFDRLPAAVYVKGFLKNYALFLGLDPSSTLQFYQPASAQASPQPSPTFLNEPLRRHPVINVPVRWAGPILLVFCLAAAGWLAFDRWGGQLNLRWPTGRPSATPTPTPTSTAIPTPVVPTDTPAPPTLTSEPTVTLTPTATPRQAAGLELRIDVVGERAWLMVEVDDQPTFAGILEPGAANAWTARERVFLRCGNAGAVRVRLNDVDLGLLGASGEVVDREWTAAGVPTRTPTVQTAN